MESPTDRFPVLSSEVLNYAISQEFLDIKKKDHLIRNPNKVSLFFQAIDFDSPFIRQALHDLRLQKEDCTLLSYQQFYDTKHRSVINLIRYMEYLTDKYRLLSSLVKRRNHYKKIHNNAARKLKQ